MAEDGGGWRRMEESWCKSVLTMSGRRKILSDSSIAHIGHKLNSFLHVQYDCVYLDYPVVWFCRNTDHRYTPLTC